MLRHTAFFVSLLTLALSNFCQAQTAPATNVTIPEGAIKVTITGVVGIVQFRNSSDAKWEKAIEGTSLTEGAELRTGPRSAVRFSIGDDQVVTLDRLGTVQILRANFESGKVFTDLGMKFGRTRYDIDSAAREHDAKVRSPSSVLAVRGTEFISQDQPPFAARAVSLDGRVMFKDAKKQIAIGGKGHGKATVDTETDSAAASGLRMAAVPTSNFTGLSATDALRNIHNLPTSAGFGIVALEEFAAYARLSNQGVANFVFRDVDLFFGLNWTGPAGSDVDLRVVSPVPGEILDRAHPALASGLAVYQDSPPADANGVGGTKSVTWPARSPTGKYQVTTTLVTKGAVAVTLDAVQGLNVIDNPVKLGPNNSPFQYTLDDAHPTMTVNVVPQAVSLPTAAAHAKIRATPKASKKAR